jgi:hypothetical protein
MVTARGGLYTGHMAALSREQFIEEILKVVPEKFPLVRLARGVDSFSLRVNGSEYKLEDLYRLTLLHPEDMRHRIERWIVELLRAGEGSPDREGSFEELKDRILPMVLTEKEVQARHSQTQTQPLVSGLFVGYAIDSDRSIAYIPRLQFESWGISQDDLHETALDNLVSRSESMAAQDEDGKISLILFQTGDGYDASRLLLPTLHERLREHLGSPFAAAIPHRDILLCFRNDEETVGRVKGQVVEDFRKMPHQVSDKLLLVTADGLAPHS